MSDHSEKRQALLKQLRLDLAGFEAILEKFLENFKDNPCYAFEWAEGDFAAAAKQKLWRDIVRSLTRTDPKIVPYEYIRAYYYKELVNKAAFSSQSTSVTVNLLNRKHLSALGDLIEMFDKVDSGWYT